MAGFNTFGILGQYQDSFVSISVITSHRLVTTTTMLIRGTHTHAFIHMYLHTYVHEKQQAITMLGHFEMLLTFVQQTVGKEISE